MIFRYKEASGRESYYLGRKSRRVSKIVGDFECFVWEILPVTLPNPSLFFPGHGARSYFPSPFVVEGSPVTKFSLVECEW